MRSFSASSFMIICLTMLSGCASYSPSDVATGPEITVKQALADVGSGFAAMKAELRDSDMKLGLYPCKVTVSFDVSASATQGGELKLSAKTEPSTTVTSAVNKVTADGSLTQTSTSESKRGNKVVVEMYSIACTPKETAGGSSPDKLGPLLNAANQGLEGAPVGRRRPR